MEIKSNREDHTLRILTIIVLILTIVQIIHTLWEFYEKRNPSKDKTA